MGAVAGFRKRLERKTEEIYKDQRILFTGMEGMKEGEWNRE